MINKDKLLSQYQSGLSLAEIAKELNCSIHKVSYWMEKHKIPRRSINDALYLKYNKIERYRILPPKTRDDYFLLGLGLGIYWGEGNKASKHAIRVTNCDPKLLISFLHFLRQICGVSPKQVSYSIVCSSELNMNTVRRYWSKQLKISPEKFGKITRIVPRGSGTYKRKCKYGVCSVSFGNIKLKQWLMKNIETGLDSLVVKRTLGKG